MAQSTCRLFCFFCILGCLSAKQCVFHDEVALLQDAARPSWPNIGDIVSKAKEAAERAAETAQNVNETVQNSLEQAANATKNAIDSIVLTVQTGLGNINHTAAVINDNTREAVSQFLLEVKQAPELQTLAEIGIELLDAFLTAFSPLVAAFSASGTAVESVLKASGFLHLSEEVGKDLTQAMIPMNATLTTVTTVKQIFRGLSANVNATINKTNTTVNRISTKISKDLKRIDELFHTTLEQVNTTFATKLTEGYELLVSHLRATVTGVLPQKYLKEVNESLDTLAPQVEECVMTAMQSPMQMGDGFNEAIGEIRASVPQEPGSARGVASLSFLSFITSACAILLRA